MCLCSCVCFVSAAEHAVCLLATEHVAWMLSSHSRTQPPLSHAPAKIRSSVIASGRFIHKQGGFHMHWRRCSLHLWGKKKTLKRTP